MTRQAPQPWWLEPGPEVCPSCGCHYHEEAGYWCCVCDRPVCPLCVVLLREPPVACCPDCRAEEPGQ
jgi:hypothetical protein